MFVVAAFEPYGPKIYNKDIAISEGFRLISEGADAIYTGLSYKIVKAMSREKIPVIGHVGYVPYRESWFGKACAVGKKADEVIQVYRDVLAYQEAGAIADPP